MISKPIFVYLQRPDNGEWVTVGRYLRGDQEEGTFRYAPSYVRAGLAWSIDPVNLPFVPDLEWKAPRYRGLHDALRDTCPDAWGRMLIRKEYGLAEDAHDSRFLLLAGNADRWGALAVGTSAKPSVANLATPRLPQLEALTQELLAIFERRAPVDAKLRKRLVATPSLGGARPKATVRDGDDYWLVKPYLPTDIADVPLLEHFAQQWGQASGLDFAPSVLHRSGEGLSVVRVLRFDRHGERRVMAISAASLLQTEHPGNVAVQAQRWSYPRLAEELKRIGAPDEDRRELFGRMIFNCIAGNDDDHPRNHAAIYRADEKRWRLSPAFDVVPNPEYTPGALTMHLSMARTGISREAVLADALRFGFDSREQAAMWMDRLREKIQQAFGATGGLLTAELRHMMALRLTENQARLAD